MPFQNPLSPEARQAIDAAVAERFQHVDNTLKMLQHQLFTRWLVAMVGLLIAGAGIYYATHQASHTSHQAKTIAVQLVLQRRESIRSTCVAQNARNANTIKSLKRNDQLALTLSRIHSFQQQLASIGVKVTVAQARHFQTLSAAQDNSAVALINALAPHQDCQRLVNQQAPLSGTH